MPPIDPEFKTLLAEVLSQVNIDKLKQMSVEDAVQHIEKNAPLQDQVADVIKRLMKLFENRYPKDFADLSPLLRHCPVIDGKILAMPFLYVAHPGCLGPTSKWNYASMAKASAVWTGWMQSFGEHVLETGTEFNWQIGMMFMTEFVDIHTVI